jgi:hypothetical protein
VRTVKDRMAQLEARKEVLEAQLAQGEGVKVSVHPSMPASTRACGQSAGCARERGCQAEAAEIMRALIDKIVRTPVCRDARRPCRSPYTATSPASSASPQKQKGRSMRAALWWSAQDWLRGLATTYTEHSWLGPNRIGGPSLVQSRPAIARIYTAVMIQSWH